ncbi:hypothetical protein AB0K47_17655 [Streptomyces tirandamycinicus]|uniref:hypothetical protein n=1 Tax=Streptomyces tirandamycinicus TaxID=2174846 RepID=UPI003431DA22
MNEKSTTHEYHNNDHTQVGAQGSTVHGGIRFYGPEPAQYAGMDRAQQIEALRGALAEARAAGEIDRETHDEAAGALDEAMRHVDASDEPSRNALVRALRKVKGLVEDASGLVSAVAAVITVVTGAG